MPWQLPAVNCDISTISIHYQECAPMGFAVCVRSAGQKYGPMCHQRDHADVTEFVTLVRLSSLGQHVGVLALAGYKRWKSALTAGPIAVGSLVSATIFPTTTQGDLELTVTAWSNYQYLIQYVVSYKWILMVIIIKYFWLIQDFLFWFPKSPCCLRQEKSWFTLLTTLHAVLWFTTHYKLVLNLTWANASV